MYIIDYNKLLKGDIILEKHDSGDEALVRESRIIRQKTKSNFSHAMLYVGNGCIIESHIEGVQANNIQRRLYEQVDDTLILRPNNESEYVKNKVEEYARLHIFQEYSDMDYKCVTNKIKPAKATEPNRQFCTRFVALAYEYAGIHIADNPDFVSSKDIENSGSLHSLGSCLKEATAEEISFAKSDGVILHQAEYNYKLLYDIRNVIPDEDIQTLAQLSEYVKFHPEKDSTISAIIKKSAYYSMWKKMEEENPWDYDYTKLKKHYGDNYQIASKEIAESAIIGIERFQMMQSEFMMLDLEYDRETFKTMWTLYQDLVQSSKKRLQAAKMALGML